MTKPFRWTVSKREQLGKLAGYPGDQSPIHAAFAAFMRDTTARMLAFSDGADLAFIGRTPENFYDYLSGAFSGIENAPRLRLVQFSLRWTGPGGVAALPPEKVAGLFDYFIEEGVSPAAIATAPRPLALVDFIALGGTMESIVRLLHLQAARDGVDWNAVQRRLRIVGLRIRTKNSPNTWRWQQHQSWLGLIPDAVIKNVSAPAHYLAYMANHQPKVTEPFHPERWGAEHGARLHDEPTRQAIALATRLFDLGATCTERRALAACIARTPEMRQPATRALVLQLRRG